MSNEAHYDLERRIAVKIGELAPEELRKAVISFMVEAPVVTIRDLATKLGVPIIAAEMNR